MSNQPFTAIAPNWSRKATTHFGKEYAALLAEQGYHPAREMTALPPVGGLVVAVATVAGQPVASPPPKTSRTLHFSGYEWNVRHIPSSRHGATKD
jgi:hypothetical protein